jgi:hypothetical protein
MLIPGPQPAGQRRNGLIVAGAGGISRHGGYSKSMPLGYMPMKGSGRMSGIA